MEAKAEVKQYGESCLLPLDIWCFSYFILFYFILLFFKEDENFLNGH